MYEEGLFPEAYIDVLFQDFEPCPYAQIGSPRQFVPFLSIADALFNIGPALTAEMMKDGTRKWQSWGDFCFALVAFSCRPALFGDFLLPCPAVKSSADWSGDFSVGDSHRQQRMYGSPSPLPDNRKCTDIFR